MGWREGFSIKAGEKRGGTIADFYLEEVLWWAVYFFEALLTGIRHGLHVAGWGAMMMRLLRDDVR